MNIALLANGPGEVWGWCRPFIREVERRNWQVDVHLLPCPYASGRELDALRTLTAHVILHHTSLNAFADFYRNHDYHVVLQMGGDLLFGRFLAWKQKIPLLCYSYGRKQGMVRCAKVMTSRDGLYQAPRMEIVGDLVLDSLEYGGEQPWNAPAGKRVAIFPGSRPQIRNKAFLFLQQIKKELKLSDPEIELRVLLSPFSRSDEAEEWREHGFSVWQGTTPAGIRGADLALTQPGTNTLELLYCRQPFAVTVPFSFLRQMPLSGLVGMIDKIPCIGAALREFIIRKRIPRYVGKTAWPNRIAGKTIVPELIGEYSAADMAAAVLELLSQPAQLLEQKTRLDELAREVAPGAPERICDIIERTAAAHVQ